MSFQPVLVDDEIYRDILREGLKSKPTPFQSNYYVHAIAVTQSQLNNSYSIEKTRDEKIREAALGSSIKKENYESVLNNIRLNPLLGSNHEYAITSGIHAEESIRANWAEKFNYDDKIEIIGFASKDDPKNFVCSCGNCRDVLKDIISPTGYFIHGNPDGIINKLPFSRVYFENYKKLQANNVSRELGQGVSFAFEAMNKSYDYTLMNKDAIYGASIVCKNGEIFSAGLEGDIAYHPSLPIRNAEILLKYSKGISKERLSIDKVVIVQNKKPKVPYKDRQYLMEFVDATNSFLNRDYAVPVYLFEVDRNGLIKNRWKTDSEEWLPFSFNPKNLGLEKELKNSISNLFR